MPSLTLLSLLSSHLPRRSCRRRSCRRGMPNYIQWLRLDSGNTVRIVNFGLVRLQTMICFALRNGRQTASPLSSQYPNPPSPTRVRRRYRAIPSLSLSSIVHSRPPLSIQGEKKGRERERERERVICKSPNHIFVEFLTHRYGGHLVSNFLKLCHLMDLSHPVPFIPDQSSYLYSNQLLLTIRLISALFLQERTTAYKY